MKNYKVGFFGTAALVLLAGLVLAACADTTDGAYSGKLGIEEFRYTLSDGKNYAVEKKMEGFYGWKEIEKGTYTQSGSTITFKPDIPKGYREYTGTWEGKRLKVRGMELPKNASGEIIADVVFED